MSHAPGSSPAASEARRTSLISSPRAAAPMPIPSSSEPTLDVSVVVPVYNSQATIPLLLERLTNALDAITDSYEIVLVDDGSPDASWTAIDAARAGYGTRVVAAQLMRNYGQHNALMCGLKLARGRYIVTLDDDLQNPPEELHKLLSHIQHGDLDLVYGIADDRQHAGWRNFGAGVVWSFYRTVFRSSITPTPYRVMRHQLVRSVLFYDLNFTYLDGLLAWCTTRIGTVPVEHHARTEGRSGYTLGKLLVLALNLYTNFSLLPLQIVSAVGLFTAVSGFAVGLYYLVQHFAMNIAVPGFASTIVAILVLGGVQLLALGVIGEYLGRLHLNVNRKPQYVIRQVR